MGASKEPSIHGSYRTLMIQDTVWEIEDYLEEGRPKEIIVFALERLAAKYGQEAAQEVIQILSLQKYVNGDLGKGSK